MSVINAKNVGRKRSGYGSRIIKTFTKNGIEYQYHATKGWRRYRSMEGGA
jgi:hypothetical protein|tara:strand:+ start:470 stop:619 length:150 start_codon:yes stop_codon:yes gene_type:complete